MKGTEYVVANKRTNEVLFRFCGFINPQFCMVTESNGPWSTEELSEWLEKRAQEMIQGKTDDEIIAALGVKKNRLLFGRMTEGRCIYALLNRFETNEDNYAVFPAYDELYAPVAMDSRFYRAYLVKGFHQK